MENIVQLLESGAVYTPRSMVEALEARGMRPEEASMLLLEALDGQVVKYGGDYKLALV